MSKPLVFILSPMCSFSPARAGALATIARALALEARHDGYSPVVVALRDPEGHAPYSDVDTELTEFPSLRRYSLAWNRGRLDRKYFGWKHFGQRYYALNIQRAVSRRGLQDAPIVILNDPRLVLHLRSAFPQARLYHWFQNQMKTDPYVRSRFASSVTTALGVSNFTASWINEWYGFGAGAVKTVYNGVNPQEFVPADQEPAGLPVLNFVGRTDHVKGPDLLLQAALELARSGHRFGVQLVGANYGNAMQDDDFQRGLRALGDQVEAQGIRVTATGHVNRPEVPGVFRRAHIHVVPSRWDEPFGLTTLEGMASGLATVASHTGGSPEVVGDNGGKTFAPNDAADLAKQLQPWLADADLRRDWARRARARATEMDWSNSWHMLQRGCDLI